MLKITTPPPPQYYQGVFYLNTIRVKGIVQQIVERNKVLLFPVLTPLLFAS